MSYTSIVPADPIVNASQLGPVFLTSFVVRNSGPSTVPNVQLVINWDGRWSPDPSQVVCRMVTTTMPMPTGRERGITVAYLGPALSNSF